jgi:hypothetical protein
MSRKEDRRRRKKRERDRNHLEYKRGIRHSPTVAHLIAKGDDMNNGAKLHRLVNRLAEAKGGERFINALTSALLGQIEDGYRLTFPVLMGDDGPMRCVALLALTSDFRLKAIRQLQVPSEATHVLVFLAFASESEWLKQADAFARLFPEQPDKPELTLEVG